MARCQAFGGKVAVTDFQGDEKLAAAAFFAARLHRPTMNTNQLPDQRKPNAAAFMTAGLRAFDLMKAVEDMGQLTLRNPDPGVLHGELDLLCITSERNANAPFKGMLEGVGEQVEDDFLPHVPVDIYRLCKRRALDGERQAPFLCRRAEEACQFCGKPRQVRCFVARLHPPRFDA